MTTVELYGERTSIEYETLTDGSVIHNVLLRTIPGQTDAGHVVRFGCLNEKQACDLAQALEETAWSEVQS